MTKLGGWRKIAGAMWGPPDDPQVYGILEFDATPLLALIERGRAAGYPVTPTHLVGRAVANALKDVPDFNVRIKGSKVIPRDTVDVFFIAAVEGGKELSGVKIERSDEKSVFEIAQELRERATQMKQGDDKEFAKTKKNIARMPKRLLRPSMRFSAYLTNTRNRDVKALGVKKQPFGSAMITSIGMFGIPQGFAPLARFYGMPLLVLVGEIQDKPLAIDGQVVIRPVISLTATIDHRYADGWHISQLIKPFRAYMEDPASFEPDPTPPSGTDPVGTNAVARQESGELLDGVPHPDEASPNGSEPARLPAESAAPTLGE
ncbi:MAG TPA: 2-oxo acid dehydrogenase subunit E2 [Actinomycetota bacterium]|nr:2-oxo acid dehydrogenase subunit E2 [Actinomycetota bacterium]